MTMSKESTKSFQLSDDAKKAMEKQHYKIVGSHSAVKTCGWTKKMINGEGGCYKLKFYGIMSNQCMQMTTSISCANRCTFCWRDYKAPVSKEWKWEVDDPEMIYNKSVEAHHKLLSGFKGSEKTNKNSLEQSKTIRHVALSLTGEPIAYPRINELIDLFNKNYVSTFLVTNAQFPDQIRDLKPVTQLYLSIDAPTKELLKNIDVPLFSDYWERTNKCLEELSKKKERTCIRLTVVKGVNDVDAPGYAKLIKKGDPDFLEVKGYMFVGASKERLVNENMPWHEEVVEFAKLLEKELTDYEIVSDHVPSRVVLLSKKKFKKDGVWHTWIDFKKYHEFVNSKEDKKFTADDYIAKTPTVGLSGRKVKLEVEAEKKRLGVNNLEKEYKRLKRESAEKLKEIVE